MTFLFSTLGRYITTRVLNGMAVVLAGVLATILLVDLVEQLRSVGSRVDITLLDAVRLTAFKAPQIVEQTLPFVMLVGAMLGISQLNRKSELVAIRASGVSAWRFLGPTAVAAALIGIASTTLLNPLATASYAAYETEKARLVGDGRTGSTPQNGVWLRQGDQTGQVVIHGAEVDPGAAQLKNAVFYFFEFDEAGALKFVRRVAAETAALRDGFWQLSGVVEGQIGAAPVTSPHLALATHLEPRALLDRLVSPATLSFWRLPTFISEARSAGMTPSRYALRWQTLLATPLMFAAMAALGAVFSLRLMRLGGQAQWALMGLGAGFVLFFGSRVTDAFASADVVAPVVAAWAPPLAAFAAALAILAFVEDE
jgi:lipopolysaccharide export system permease protein